MNRIATNVRASNEVSRSTKRRQRNSAARRHLSPRTGALLGAVSAMALSAMPAMALNWDPTGVHSAAGGGAGTWNSSNVNWWSSGATDTIWDSTIAVFGQPTTAAATVTLSGNLSATGLTFNTSGYTVTNTSGTNTLQLTGATPTFTMASGVSAVLGTNPASATAPTTFQLTGSNGFTVTGGGELILANAVGVSGGITVNNGSTLTIGNRNLGSGVTPTTFLNNNNLNLNGSSLTIATGATLTATPLSIGTITVSGTSNINVNRVASASSTSVNLQNTPLVMSAGSQLNVNPTGNTTTTGPFVQFQSTTMNGAATFQAGDNGTNGENIRLGNLTDNGFNATFLSGGTATLFGTQIRLAGYSTGSSTTGGTWTLGSATGGGTAGVQLDAVTNTGTAGQITDNTITVNASSQLEFDGVGQLAWGKAGQTININGGGITNGTNGAIFFFSTTTSGIGVSNDVLANFNLQSSSTIAVTTNTTSQIDGNITGTGTLTKGAAGTLILNGSANSWVGGTTITSGSLQVTNASSIATGALSIASDSTPSSPSLVLNNASQTVGSLSSSFKASTGSASNTITLNGTALNIKQTTNTTWGPGAVPTLSSTIQDGGSPGSVALDATSTGTLSFSGPNTYSGGTTLNGGTLIAANTSGSATGSGPVAVSGGSLGGSGSVSGAVTVTNGALLPGTPVGTSHIGGTLTTGALALNGGSMTFNLNTPASSDSITASTLSVGGAVSININNLGALGAATYHLINYGGSLGGSFGNLTLGSQPAGFSFSLQNNANHVDLLVTAANANVWTAATDTNWDTSTPNWTGAGSLFVPGDSVVFDDTANGVSPLSVSIPADVSPGLVTFNNNSKSYTVGGAGKIAGNANLVVAGTGSVTLTSQNSFTGAVAIAGGGMLSISADNQLGNANNGVSLTSSVPAQLSTLQVSSTYTSARSLTLYSLGGAVDVTGANTLTLTGAIAGGGGLTKSNTGTLVLTGTGSYTGATNVTGGSLKLGAAAVSPALSALTIASGATVDTVTFNNSAGSLAGAGNLAIGTAATFSAGFNNSSTLFSGVISGTGTFAKTGTGTLTLTGVANNVTSAGAFSVSGGGKLIAAQGGLGTATAAPTIALSGASTLQFSTPYTYTTQVVNMGGNGIIDLGSNAATLSFLSGTGVLTVQNGPSLKLVNSPSSTAAANTGGVVVGNGTDGGVVLDVAGAVTGSGIPAIGTGIVTVNQNSTFWLDNIKDGFNSTTGLPTGTGNGAITFKANSTWKATGSTIYSGGSPTIDTGATVTISVPTSTDQLVDNTAIRNPATGNQQDTTNAINVTGNGLLQIGSGGVSATSSNQFGGTWTIGTASTSPRVVLNAIKGGFGETLNAFGYAAGSPAGAGSPVTMVSGTLAFGADAPNPSASSPLAGANSFRSPLVLQGGSIASTGQEYDVPASTTTAGAQFNAAANAAVSANLAGDITLAGTVNALTYDPIGAAPTVGRNLNFTNDVSVSSASFTWNAGATLAVTAGSSTGGAINFARTAGTVTFNSGAALNISANSTVNVGKQFTAGSYTGATFNPGSLQNVAGVVDPFTDSSATGNDTTQSVSATISGTLDYAAQAAAAGTRTYRLGATAITNGLLKLDAAASVADRTILVVGNLTFSGAGSMDLGRGEILTTTAASDVRTAVLNGKITTSSSDPAIGAIAIGYKDLGGGITEARYTLKGDANLSGNVDVGDLGVLATNYGITGGQVWSTGDFSGDGTVDVADLGALATNYNATLGGAGSGSSATLAAAPLAVLAGASSAVPEPTSMGLLALGATSLLARRRRRLA